MAVSVTYYATIITWNSVTWDKTSGGPLEATYTHGGEELSDRTGDDFYAPFNVIVDAAAHVTVRLREVKQALVPGTKSNLAVTMKTKAGTVVMTFVGMVLQNIRGAQGRAHTGDVELVFGHESADGTTAPMA